MTPPTEAEFLNLCRRSKKRGKSASISGLTYNMVKHWPEELIKHVYALLMKLWEHKHIPMHHKWRFFCLIPKIAGSAKLEHMRPISLLDVMRKIWLGFFVGRITGFIERNALLDPTQNAYRCARGTDSASLPIINALEVIREQETSGAFSSFDIKRAFDSVSKNLSRLALIRMGVPEVLVEYIVAHDHGGMVFVRTPLVLDTLRDLVRKKEISLSQTPPCVDTNSSH